MMKNKNVELIKTFCEENFELFQEWLEERDIESSDAEVILDGLEGSNGDA
jgi:hypothetical protein